MDLKLQKKKMAKAMLAIALGMGSVSVFAQSTINIKAQPLSTALSELAREKGVNILVPDNLIAHKLAPAVKGEFTVDQILKLLLSGTGLVSELKSDKTYVIHQSNVSPPEANSSLGMEKTMPTIDVTANSISTDSGFVADATTTATRTDTPISVTPQSIQVITSDIIKSQQARSVTDTLGYVSGITVNTGDTTPDIKIRGFKANTMSNGSNDTANGTANSLGVPMVGIERVEVLKGANSILAGVMSPGGIVNVVTKQPTAKTVHELTLETGSNRKRLAGIDLGGSLSENDELSYRFILSGEKESESFGGYDGGKNFYVAPSLGWKTEKSNVILAYQHQVRNIPGVPATLILPETGPMQLQARPTPPQSSLYQSDTLSLDWTQKIGSNFKFQSKTQYQTTAYKYNNFYQAIGGTPEEATFFGTDGKVRSYGLDTDNHLQTKLTTGPVKQTFLTGMNYSLTWGDQYGRFPVISAPFPAPSLPLMDGDEEYTKSSKTYFSNYYFQDQVVWGGLHILASVSRGTSWSVDGSQSAWTPNFGLLYQLTDSIAVYGNALRSFTPQTSLLADGKTAPPSKGRSVEGGFKFNFMDDKLNVTTAAFRNEITNQATYLPGSIFSVLTGGQVTRGGELNVAGNILPGLNLIASYTFTQQEKISDGSSAVPKHSGSLWMTYDIQKQQFKGWGAGLGIRARSDYQITSSGVDYKVPGQAQTDFNIHYKTDKWSTTVGIKNIFDRKLYQDENFASGNVVVLEPDRQFDWTITYNF